jgi:hypothetical protein
LRGEVAVEDGVKEFLLAHPQSFELVENGGSNKIHIAFCEKKNSYCCQDIIPGIIYTVSSDLGDTLFPLFSLD